MWYLWFAVLALHGGLLILADLGRLLPPSLAAVELARCCGVVSAAAVEPSSTTSPPLAGTGGRSMEPLPAHELQVYRGAPPQARFSPVILVATVDGFVSALNASSGQILWTRDSLGGPVVQNLPVRSKPRPKAGTTPVKAESRSQDRPSDAEDPNAPVQWVTSSSSSPSPAHPTESSMHAIADIHLVAPFDSGKIYKLKPDKVLIDSLLTVKELVHKSPSRSNGMLYLGSKRTKYFALDVATGRVVNAFGVDDGDIGLTEHGIPASWRNNDSPGASPLLSQIEDRHTIYLARTEYRLRIYNSHTGELKWNVLYSEYEPDSVLPITQHPALHASQQLRLFTSHQGVLVAQDPRTEEVLWTQQLPSSAATIFRLWTYGSHNPWMLVTAPLDRLDPSDTTPPSNTPRRGQASGQPVALHSQYTTHSALVDTTEAGGLFVYPGPAPVTNTAPSAKPGVKQIIQTVSRKLIEKITSWPRVARTGHSSTKPTPTSSDTIDEWSLLGKCDPTFRSGPPYTAPDTDSNNSRHHNEPDARGGQKEPLADTAFACGLEHAHHASCLVGHYNVLSANENQHLTGSGLLESTSSPQLPPSSPAILDPVFYHNDHHPHRWAPEPSIVIHYPAYQDMRLMPTYRNGQLIPPTFPTPDAYQIARYPSLLWRILGLLYQGLVLYWARLWWSLGYTLLLMLTLAIWLVRHHQWSGRELIDTHLPMLWRMPHAFADRFIVHPLLRELWSYRYPGLPYSAGFSARNALSLPASSEEEMALSELRESTLTMSQQPVPLTHDDTIDDHGTFASPVFDPAYPRRIGHLLISEHVLGRGSHGTCVYLGKFGADRVAVKQLLTANYDIADREVSILEASRSHPNVIQYRCCTRDRQFLYIALDLCQASLYDLVQAYQSTSAAGITADIPAVEELLALDSSESQWQPSQHSERQLLGHVLPSICPRQALRGLAEGLDFLHRCNIVHRDLKPQNILVQSATLERCLEDYRQSMSNESGQADEAIMETVQDEKAAPSLLPTLPTGADATAKVSALTKFRQRLATVLSQRRSTDAADPLHIRLLISDFGLCKRLELGQNTFFNTTAHGLGTLGWRAPECVRDPSRLDQLVLRASSGSSRPASHSTGSSAVASLPLTHTLSATFHASLRSGEHNQITRGNEHIGIGEKSADVPALPPSNHASNDQSPVSENLPSTSHASNQSTSAASAPMRLTKAVDIFAMGCVFYFFLTRGAHPFGEELLRDYHIIQGEPDFTAFYQNSSIDSPTEALDLIRRMISAQPEERPTTAQVLQHPYFWNKEKRLEFMYKVSDCLRLKAKDPQSPLAMALETQFDRIVGPNGDWFKMLDPPIQHSVREKRSFDSSRLQTLLTAIRNKGVHYSEASFKVKQIYGSYPDGYYDYFARRFPDFFLYIYEFSRQHPELHRDDFLRQYFDGC